MLALVPLGLGTKHYHGPAQGWARASAGDILYAAFWFFVVKWLWPRASTWRAATAVFLYSTAVEFSQLLHTPGLDRLRHTTPGRLLLGTEFAWADLVYYLVGAAIAAGVIGIIEGRCEPASHHRS
jgi:hypothetical protein